MLQSQIEMHFTEILHLSKQLRALSKIVKNFSEVELMQEICEIKVGWNSECADVLAQKEGKILEGISIEAEKMNKVAEEMEEWAKKMYQSEMTNSQIAVFRSYR
ncbi:hypothetical protein [Parablautia muri]|uniref:Uncharacterized protein n=1 Tax=Parablautia muri TaxID=2320879 RepID=A0A9X5BGC7_9FIRM|nr:hypothetical protein [Parablautia muri]NBJ93586.1 hypothetical protein [Parablautia muri]